MVDERLIREFIACGYDRLEAVSLALALRDWFLLGMPDGTSI